MSHAYIDGKFVPRTTITVNPADFGFARGVAVFELARVYGGAPFHLPDHLDRLAHGAKMLGIPLPHNLPELEKIASEVIARNGFAHSAIKFYLTAGECQTPAWHGYSDCRAFTPHLMLMEDEVKPAHPDAPYGMDLYQRGQRLKSVPFERELPTIKSTNYMLGYFAAREYAGAEWDDILFTHRDGYITEATRSNFFCVIDGVLCTPRRGMLFGITRKILLQLAPKIGITVSERDLRPADLARATEAFTTGSVAELIPVAALDEHRLGSTIDGVVYAKLRAAFTAYIQEQTRVFAAAS